MLSDNVVVGILNEVFNALIEQKGILCDHEMSKEKQIESALECNSFIMRRIRSILIPSKRMGAE